MMWPLSGSEKTVLARILDGWSLKSHRDMDGNKEFVLHALNGEKMSVKGETVHKLRRRQLIETNHKFPAATFLLTEKGREAAEKLTKSQSTPF